MYETQTLDFKWQLHAAMDEITFTVAEIENKLYMQCKQRPYNVPYIRCLEQLLKYLHINYQHIKDRFDKVDGCF